MSNANPKPRYPALSGRFLETAAWGLVSCITGRKTGADEEYLRTADVV